MTDNVAVSTVDRVATITLHRPPVNALDSPTIIQLQHAFEQVSGDENVHVVVLRGTGRGFCAGADLGELRGMTSERRAARSQLMDPMFERLLQIPVPTICAMHGFAVGSGLALAAECDIRVASVDAFFCLPEVTWGAMGGGGAHFRRLNMPVGQIREMIFTGRRFSSHELLSTGFLQHVVPADDLERTVMSIVDEIAAKHRTTLMFNKRSMLEEPGYTSVMDAFRATYEFGRQLVDIAGTQDAVRSTSPEARS